MTPDFLNISQLVFFPSDQWMMSLMQWAMPEDAPTPSQVPEQEGGGNVGVGEQCARDSVLC